MMNNQIQKQRKDVAPFWLASWMYFLKVKFGGGITDARGSIAGNTYSRNHYGAYMRARVTPVNPNTARQQLVKASIAFLADMWSNTLTAPQRTAWELYGSSVAMIDSLGATMYLTGYNHFIRSNVIAKMIPYPLVSAGPTVFEIPAQDPTLAVSLSEATQVLTIAYDDTMDWATENLAYMFFFQGKPQNPQRNAFSGPWRLIGSVAGVDPAGPVEPHAGTAVFAVAEGQRQWIYARIMRADGRLSEPFRADNFCAA
jgi:hypothetical protein